MKNNLKWQLVVLAAGIIMSGAAARAGEIDVVLGDPDQTGAPGSTLQYLGSITNTTGNTIFLNSDDLNLAGLPGDFTIDDQFFNTVPISLDAGQSSGDIELFDVTIS